MAPRGKKFKDGVSKQMEVWEGNRGLQIMVTMGYIIGSGIGRTLNGMKWPVEPVCDWSCPSVDSWPIFKCSPILFRNKTTEICVSHCRKFVWKSHPHYSHMGIFWAKKGSSRICIQYWAPKTLVSCPTRWFLLLTFGFLWWSSSWWWQPHIAGCKLFRPLLRAGISVFDHFFCKMYFLYVSGSCKKNLADFFWVLPPQKSTFLWTGWLAGQISGIEGMPSILENCIIKK